MTTDLDEPRSRETEVEEALEHQMRDPSRTQALGQIETERNDARMRAKLSNPKTRRFTYRDLADECTSLTHAQFRVLSCLLRMSNPELTNVFPSQKTAARALGMTPSSYNKHLIALRKAGWLKTHEFYNEHRQSSSGIQFCIPPRVLPGGSRWEGPVEFGNRQVGRRKISRTSNNK
jgi:DNA-binding transcriptional ArsR family regulator